MADVAKKKKKKTLTQVGLTRQDGWRIKLIKCGEYKEEGEEHVDEEEEEEEEEEG